MNCKNCKYYVEDVELHLLTATSIDPEYDDLNITTSLNKEYLEQNYITEDWYRETYKDFEIKTQNLGHCKAGKIEYGSKFGITDSLFYWDSEDYSAGYCVGPYFGCIHFKDK